MKIADGFCQCGCGNSVGRYKQTRPLKGIVKGNHQKYLHGHNTLLENNPNWKGGKTIRSDGYIQISVGGNKHVMQHVLICEKILGKLLPTRTVIHHANENRSENVNSNLVICQNIAYHRLLHKRINALRISGHANWDRCQYCRKYDDPMKIFHTKYGQKYHKECKRIYQIEYRKGKRGKNAYC